MIHTIQNQFLTVSVKSQGAELQSIAAADGMEFLWQGDPAYWKGRAPNLFPYVARLTGGEYSMDGKVYKMERHGFSRAMEFALVENTGTRLVLEITDTPETLGWYPRKFAFRVIYAMRDNELDVTYAVEDRDEKTMYFGLGAHPGFRAPLRPGQRFEDWRLRFDAPENPRRVGFTEDCFTDGTDTPYPLTDNAIPLTHGLFDRDAVVLTGSGHAVTLEGAGESRSVTVLYPGMDYVGFWHMPGTDAPYVCIEPWCSLPSAHGKHTVFEKKADLLSLQPGGVYLNTWTIRVNGL